MKKAITAAIAVAATAGALSAGFLYHGGPAAPVHHSAFLYHGAPVPGVYGD